MSNYFYKNLLGLSSSSGKSISAIANDAGLPPSTLTRLVRRGPEKANPSENTIAAIAKAFDIPVADLCERDLFEDLGLVEVPPPCIRPSSNERMHDFFSMRYSMARENAPKSAPHNEHIANSDAMAPIIRDGDQLFIESPRDAKSGDIVIAQRKDGKEVVARLMRDGDTMWGHFENAAWPGDRIFPLTEIKWKVIGLKRMF